jgi:hypothetical protein
VELTGMPHRSQQPSRRWAWVCLTATVMAQCRDTPRSNCAYSRQGVCMTGTFYRASEGPRFGSPVPQATGAKPPPGQSLGRPLIIEHAAVFVSQIFSHLTLLKAARRSSTSQCIRRHSQSPRIRAKVLIAYMHLAFNLPGEADYVRALWI